MSLVCVSRRILRGEVPCHNGIFLLHSVEDGMNISFRQLQVFLAVYEAGSFTVAANGLHISQSAASKMVAELENQLGMPLFERTTRTVVPNDAAREFFEFAQDVTATMATAKRSITELITLERGKVSVAASPLMHYGLLAGPIASYRQRYPGIDFEIHECSTDETLDRVRSGVVDIGFCATDSEISGLEATVAIEDAMYAIVDDAHPLARRRSIRAAELLPYNYISLRDSYSIRRTLDQIFARTPLRFENHIEVGSLTAALGFARQGAGFLIVPGYAADIAQQWGMRRIAISDLASFRHRISLIRRRTTRLSVAARHWLAVLPQSFPLLK